MSEFEMLDRALDALSDISKSDIFEYASDDDRIIQEALSVLEEKLSEMKLK